MKTISATGWTRRRHPAAEGPRGAFTLVELLLVMLLLAGVLAVAAPRLARFASLRTLRSEAARIRAVLEYARQEAIASGIPTVVWFQPELGLYGLERPPGYPPLEGSARQYELHDSLTLRTENVATLPTADQMQWVFLPDGTLQEVQLPTLVVEDQDQDRLYVATAWNELGFAILTPEEYALRLEQLQNTFGSSTLPH